MKKANNLQTILSIVVGILVIGSMTWVIMFLNDQITGLEKIGATKNERYQVLTAKDAKREEVTRELSTIDARVEEINHKFPGAIIQENLILSLRDLEQAHNCLIIRMSFEDIQLDRTNQPIDEKKITEQRQYTANNPGGVASAPVPSSNPNAANNPSKSKINQNEPVPGLGMKMPLNLELKSSYSNIKSFILSLESLLPKVGLREMRLQQVNDTPDDYTCSIKLDFYGFMPPRDISSQ